MPEGTLRITAACVERVAELLAEHPSDPNAGLRIEVEAGGCSGYQYRLALDRRGPDDVVVDRAGIQVFTAPGNLRFVRGATIDYADGRFHIDNPNVVYGCGCGNSFQLREQASAPA